MNYLLNKIITEVKAKGFFQLPKSALKENQIAILKNKFTVNEVKGFLEIFKIKQDTSGFLDPT